MEEYQPTPQEMMLAREMEEGYRDLPLEKPDQKFLEQLNPESIVDNLEMMLRGYRWNREKGRWEPIPHFKPKLNEEGINEIMFRIRTYVNPHNIYGNIDEELARRMTITFATELATYLALNYKKFGMDVIDIRKIVHLASDAVFQALARGEEALTLKLLRTMIETKELSAKAEKPQEERKGFFSWLCR
jgi:hypothetical protein